MQCSIQYTRLWIEPLAFQLSDMEQGDAQINNLDDPEAKLDVANLSMPQDLTPLTSLPIGLTNYPTNIRCLTIRCLANCTLFILVSLVDSTTLLFHQYHFPFCRKHRSLCIHL